MKLLGVEKRGGWLYSEWNLTYRAGWKMILSAANLIREYTKDAEIFTGDASGEKQVEPDEEKGLSELEEAGYLTIRGTSEIFRIPLMITFINQSDIVRAHIACATEEFQEADYKNFNLSMCQFMDSAEIAMFS